MSDDRAKGFLQHITAEPDDNTPRLIYADWLDEQGESARAEFIRVQVERASLPKWEARQVLLALRERALLKKHARKWRAELPRIKGVQWGEFRRGFMATASFNSFTSLREHAAAYWAATPLEAVSVRWPRPQESVPAMAPIAGLRELSVNAYFLNYEHIQHLAQAPLLATVRVLTVGEAGLGSQGLQRLVASPHLGNLKALRLPDNAIGNEGVDALLGAASLTSLEELDLSQMSAYGRYGEDPIVTTSGLESLAAWSGMKRLRVLNLSGHEVTAAGLRLLLRSAHAAGLKELVLRESYLNGRDMRELEAARPGLQLDALDLSANLIGDPGAGHVAQAGCLSELKVLQLAACEITASGARRLARAPFLATLRELHAYYCSFGPEGVQAILEKSPPHLHTLSLENNNLCDEGAALLAESPASDTLLDLRLAANRLGDRAARALARSEHLQNLRILGLYLNRISKRVRTALRGSPLGKRLAVLEMTEPRRRRR